MGLFTKDIKTMDDLFLHVMQDVYYAENQIVKSLPEMIEKATSPKLADGLKSHLAETIDSREAARAGLPDVRQAGQRCRLPGDRRHHR